MMSKFAAVAATAALALAGCGSVEKSDDGAGSAASGGRLRVGMMYPMDGPYQQVGTTERQAAELFLKEHDGKIGGLEAELFYENQGATAAVAQVAMRKLLQERIQVLTGIPDMAMSPTVAPLAKQAGIPAVTSTNTLVPSDLWWTVSYGLGGEFASISQYLSEKYRTVATIAGDNASGHAVAGGIVGGFTQGGGKIAAEVYTPAGRTDFQPYLSKIKAAAPDAVFAWYAGAEAVAFVKQWAEFGLAETTQLYGISLTQEALLEAEGDAALGVRVENEWARGLDTPQNPAFVSAYKEAYGEYPDEFAEWQWSALQIIDQAVGSIRGDVTPAAIQDAVAAMRVIETPRGKWEFGPKNEPNQHYYLTEVVRNDQGELENKVVTDLGYWTSDGKPSAEPK